jgi:hypothetical protein
MGELIPSKTFSDEIFAKKLRKFAETADLPVD